MQKQNQENKAFSFLNYLKLFKLIFLNNLIANHLLEKFTQFIQKKQGPTFSVTPTQTYRLHYFVVGNPVPAHMEWHAEWPPLFIRPRAHGQRAAPSGLSHPCLSEGTAGQSTGPTDFLEPQRGKSFLLLSSQWEEILARRESLCRC